MSIDWFSGLLVGWQLEDFIPFLQHNEFVFDRFKTPD